MNKRSYTVVLAATLLASMIALPVQAGNNNPNKWLGSPAYVLNILGKKDDWSANGDFSNPDRHTMFVPMGSAESTAEVRLWISQAPKRSDYPFMVLDGNAFDDGDLSLQMADGYYEVYAVALGKPVKESSYITGTVADPNDGSGLIFLGGVDAAELKPHGKQPVWEEYSNLFYITEAQMAAYLEAMGFDPARAADLAAQIMAFFSPDYIEIAYYDAEGNPVYGIWIYDFYEFIANYLQYLMVDGDPDISNVLDGEYYWNLKNNGIRHIQIRFYKVKSRDWVYLPPAE
jgi:hypothetical protein